MSEWKEYKLGDVVTFQRGFDITSKDLIDGIYPIVSSSGTTAWHNQFKVRQPGVVIGRKGTLGKVYYLAHDYWPHDTTLWVKDFHGNHPLFVFYFLKTLGLGEYDVGSSNPTLNRNHIHLLPVSVPSLALQKEIASILSSLDDKIDLLHRQNKTLETMAETLFRQWFVEEAEESWEELSLYDAIDLIGGGTPKTSETEYWDGAIGWLSGGDISGNHKNFVTKAEKSITELGLKNSSARLLPKFSTVISARGTVGKYCMLAGPMTFSQSNYGIKPKYDNCFFFTYLLIAHSVEELRSAAYGSVFDTITTNTFKEHKVSLPISEIIEEFELEVEPYFLKMLNNQIQIQSLTQVRDTLLPKLMSGEILTQQKK